MYFHFVAIPRVQIGDQSKNREHENQRNRQRVRDLLRIQNVCVALVRIKALLHYATCFATYLATNLF